MSEADVGVVAVFASDLGRGTVQEVIETAIAGAQQSWRECRFFLSSGDLPVLDEGSGNRLYVHISSLAIEFFATVAGEEVLCERCMPCLAYRPKGMRLITLVTDAPLNKTSLSENLHKALSTYFNEAPAQFLIGQPALKALLECAGTIAEIVNVPS